MKAKKTLTTICLVLILLLSSVILFACGDKSSSKEAYNAYTTLISDMKKDTSLFSSDKILGMESQFYLNDFAYKNNSNEKVFGYNNYVALASIGLEYIAENQGSLDGLEADADYSGLVDDAKALRKSYNSLKVEHDKLINEASGLDYRIYNGYFARYRTQAMKFINQTFDCALSLGDFLNSEAKLSKTVGSEEMTVDALNFYVDYNVLKMFDDIRIYYMDSCEGVAVEDESYNDVTILLSNWVSLYTKGYKALTQEQIKPLQTIFDRVNADRNLGQQAVRKFSFYKYSTTYGYSLDAYKKSSENATVYYNMAVNYYFNTIPAVYNYMTANVVA